MAAEPATASPSDSVQPGAPLSVLEAVTALVSIAVRGFVLGVAAWIVLGLIVLVLAATVLGGTSALYAFLTAPGVALLHVLLFVPIVAAAALFIAAGQFKRSALVARFFARPSEPSDLGDVVMPRDSFKEQALARFDRLDPAAEGGSRIPFRPARWVARLLHRWCRRWLAGQIDATHTVGDKSLSFATWLTVVFGASIDARLASDLRVAGLKGLALALGLEAFFLAAFAAAPGLKSVLWN